MTTTETKRYGIKRLLTKDNLVPIILISMMDVISVAVLFVFTIFVMHGRVFP